MAAALRNAAPALLDAWEEREAAWSTLGVSKEDRESNDDPDVATLAQSIAVMLEYERDQRAMANEMVDSLRSERDRLRSELESLINDVRNAVPESEHPKDPTPANWGWAVHALGEDRRAAYRKIDDVYERAAKVADADNCWGTASRIRALKEKP